MADETTPTPGGAVPPKPPEASKIQPKKETVRINLPPKPSAAPTIKLPTLPPGGPTAPAPMPTAAPAAAAAPAVARSGAAPVAPAAAQRPVQRPVVQQAAPALSGLDFGLAIAAAVMGLLAVGSTVYCITLFN
jgi:hypothetical protein